MGRPQQAIIQQCSQAKGSTPLCKLSVFIVAAASVQHSNSKCGAGIRKLETRQTPDSSISRRRRDVGRLHSAEGTGTLHGTAPERRRRRDVWTAPESLYICQSLSPHPLCPKQGCNQRGRLRLACSTLAKPALFRPGLEICVLVLHLEPWASVHQQDSQNFGKCNASVLALVAAYGHRGARTEHGRRRDTRTEQHPGSSPQQTRKGNVADCPGLDVTVHSAAASPSRCSDLSTHPAT